MGALSLLEDECFEVAQRADQRLPGEWRCESATGHLELGGPGKPHCVFERDRGHGGAHSRSLYPAPPVTQGDLELVANPERSGYVGKEVIAVDCVTGGASLVGLWQRGVAGLHCGEAGSGLKFPEGVGMPVCWCQRRQVGTSRETQS